MKLKRGKKKKLLRWTKKLRRVVVTEKYVQNTDFVVTVVPISRLFCREINLGRKLRAVIISIFH